MKRSFAIIIALFITINLAHTQDQFILKGQVLESEKQYKLIGANVYLEQVQHGTLCDIDGNFELVSGQPFPWELTVSYIGYKDKKVTIEKQEDFRKIYLEEDPHALDRVIICPVPSKYAMEQNSISGLVVDKKTQEPILGANIHLKGTELGTVTNRHGGFSLSIPKEQQKGTVLISYLGYQEQVLENISKGSILQIEMEEGSLDCKLVITKKKKKFLGIFKRKDRKRG